MKRKLITSVLVLLGAVIISATYLIATASTKLEKLVGMPISDVDLSTLADGNYIGSYTILPISVKVAVTVTDRNITDITLLKHFNGQGAGADIIPDKVTEAQSLNVDIVSGATYSSKIILMAIRDALSH